MERRGIRPGSVRKRKRSGRGGVPLKRKWALFAWLLAAGAVLLGILLPCLLLQQQKNNWMKQQEWVAYEPVLPLQFNQGLNFVAREAAYGEMQLEEAQETCRNQLELLLENGVLEAGYYWPSALELQNGLLAEEQPVWKLVYGVSKNAFKQIRETALVEVQMDAISGQLYQVGYLEMQTDAGAFTECNAYRTVQNFVYPYLGREGIVLESSDNRQASMLLDDGSFVFCCWGEDPWYQYIAILDANDYEQREKLRDAWLSQQEKEMAEAAE